MGRKRFEQEIGEELDAGLTRLESAVWSLVWLLGAICAAMLVAYGWLLARGHALDGDMNAVAASIGGG